MVPASGSGYNGWPIHAGSIYYYQPDDHYHQLNGRPPHPDRGQETRWEMPVKSIMKPCFAIWLICGLFGLAGHYLSPVHAMEPTASHAPLPYRIVSFHQGQADMELIKLARVAGYNGVQIQTERGTLEPLEQFAEYNQRTHLVENCHQLGMQVSIWIHELNDIPAEFLHKPDAGKLKPGEIVCNYEFAGDQKVVLNINDSKLWALLGERYDYILTKLIPDVDVLILTVTETQIHATNPELFVPLVRFLDDKCRKYGKRLAVRTFVWHPQDLNNLMTTIQKLPEDVMVMSKCVPQDWHLRSINAPELGQVGNHGQIEEWDVAGEYFGLNKLVNCMPELLQRQFDSGMSKGIQGICVRVDRSNQSVRQHPSEINMWALGLLATGRATTPDQIWKTWATNRYGSAAGLALIPALIQTTEVVQEALYIDSFSFYDPRKRLGPAGEADPFQHPANPQFWSDKYRLLHDRLVKGDPAMMVQVESNKLAAIRMASNAVILLEGIRPLLKPADYAQLRNGLLNNQVQIAWRAPMHFAYLRHRLLVNTSDTVKRAELTAAIRKDLEAMRSAVKNADPGVKSDGDQALKWADEMEHLLR